MAKVHVQNVVVLDNPSNFSNPFQFEITFECVEDLQEDLEWEIIYVDSAESEAYDQVLDAVYVGHSRWVNSLIGFIITVLLVVVSYISKVLGE